MMGNEISDKSVNIKNRAWREDLICRYHCLLVGGSLFDSRKHEFLLQKPTESIRDTSPQGMPGSGSHGSAPGPGGVFMPSSFSVGMDQYTYRLKKASYKPMISSLFGYLASRVFPNPPEIIGGEKYTALVDDCDGDGRGILAVARDALINALAYSVQGAPCGSYLYLPDIGAGDLRLSTADARTAIDWIDGPAGDMQRIRTRTVEPMRDDDFGPETKEKWTWTIYTESGMVQQIAVKEIGTPGTPKNLTAESSSDYGYEAVPFVRVKLPEHQYLMDQLASPIVEAFNLESDIASLCGKISNAQLVISTMDNALGRVILPQLGVIKVGQGESAMFISPDSKCAMPLFQYKDALRESLFNAINASAMRASADFVQNPRQAATAKAMDLEPWRAWSLTFSSPVRSAFIRALRIMANFYGEAEPKLTWPEPLDISLGGINDAIGGGPMNADGAEKDMLIKEPTIKE